MKEKQEAGNRTVQTEGSPEGKYLSFALGGEEYGIGILRIREIIGMMPITFVPGMPEYLKGLINLRGKVIPVVDLRLRFGMEEAEITDKTCIIVVEAGTDSGRREMGIVVDAVQEVLPIRSDQIEETPEVGNGGHREFFTGVARTERGVKMLLDIDRVLCIQEMGTGGKEA